jgi:hypothetical protein
LDEPHCADSWGSPAFSDGTRRENSSALAGGSSGSTTCRRRNAPPEIVYRRLHLPAPSFEEWLAADPPDACIHAAGRASVPLSMTDPASDFSDGVVLTFFSARGAAPPRAGLSRCLALERCGLWQPAVATRE